VGGRVVLSDTDYTSAVRACGRQLLKLKPPCQRYLSLSHLCVLRLFSVGSAVHRSHDLCRQTRAQVTTALHDIQRSVAGVEEKMEGEIKTREMIVARCVRCLCARFVVVVSCCDWQQIRESGESTGTCTGTGRRNPN
jgi:hypothetical protein